MNNYVDYYNYMNNLNTNLNVNQISMPNAKMKFDYTTDPSTAFMRGNLFNNLYTPYKNYRPVELNPMNEKEYALLLVQMYAFAAHELTLYLDTNPTDSNAIKLRSNYMNMHKQAVAQYESKYGPLGVDSKMLEATPWALTTKTWPWEGSK